MWLSGLKCIDIFSSGALKSEEGQSLGVTIINEHDKLDLSEEYFDVESFLLYSCLDEVASIGLQKAFYVQSQHSTGDCTLDDLYKVFFCEVPNH